MGERDSPRGGLVGGFEAVDRTGADGHRDRRARFHQGAGRDAPRGGPSFRWRNPMSEKNGPSRRDFFRLAGVAASSLLAPIPVVADEPKARVVLIRRREVLTAGGKLDGAVLRSMLDEALTALYQEKDAASAWRRVARPGDVVGVKSNSWNRLATPPRAGGGDPGRPDPRRRQPRGSLRRRPRRPVEPGLRSRDRDRQRPADADPPLVGPRLLPEERDHVRPEALGVPRRRVRLARGNLEPPSAEREGEAQHPRPPDAAVSRSRAAQLRPGFHLALRGARRRDAAGTGRRDGGTRHRGEAPSSLRRGPTHQPAPAPHRRRREPLRTRAERPGPYRPRPDRLERRSADLEPPRRAHLRRQQLGEAVRPDDEDRAGDGLGERDEELVGGGVFWPDEDDGARVSDLGESLDALR